jgi:hypothetical protein
MKLPTMSWTLLTASYILFSTAGARPEPAHPLHDSSLAPVALTLKLSEVRQTIHSFGASDGWTCKFIGQWADNAKKQQVADWLFSTDTLTDGSPKGIGLSLWRFNIGSGSFEQGDSSHISDEWRREYCFLDSNGAYNWSEQAGQQWFLEAARQRGVRYTLGFSLTPPVFMTRNGKAFSAGGTSLNIKPGLEERYADFLAKVTQHFRFSYLSPFNEPQWGWAAGNNGRAGQEGSPATNPEIANMVKLLSQKLAAAGSSAKVVIGEAGQLDFLYGRNSDGRGDQIAQFFKPGMPNYIGNLPNVARTISYHSYFTTCPDSTLFNTRLRAAARVSEMDDHLDVWQSEFGILGDICKQLNGRPRNTSIDYGLYVAKVLHHDLSVANVTSWQWWLAVSPYNYSDALVYVNDPSGGIDPANCKQDGRVLDSKQLWCFGNYARFIRPGMQRINMTSGDTTLQASAYKSSDGRKLVVVLINTGTTQKTGRLEEQGRSVQLYGPTVNVYTTDALNNMKRSKAAVDSIPVGPRSVVTLTAEIRRS